jgi:hypothetical protein
VDDETAHGRPIGSLEALLQATNYSSLDELSGMVDADLELDTVIRELDPEDGPGVEILVHGAGIWLTYPFTITEFWEAVQDLDEQESERLAEEW